MSQYNLADKLFLYPTPLGCYFAISSDKEDKSRNFIKNLLQLDETPPLNAETLMDLMDVESEEKALTLLHHCQKIGWVQGLSESIKSPEGSLELILPSLLSELSETGKILLADDQGFYLACHDFPHEVAEELSALSAEMASMHQRRSGVLMDNLGLGSHAWSVVDLFGNSQTGFWPVFIGNSRFVIIISGVPHFNQPNFVTMIWALNIRYGTTKGSQKNK